MSIRIEKKGRRIEVRSSEVITGMKTAIPGAYLTAGGYWTVPLSIESCKLLREKFGRRLMVGTELGRWARMISHSRREMAKLAKSHDVKLQVLPKIAPKLYRAMRKRKYQCVGVRFVADNSAVLIADEPGLGKTLIAMGGILEAEIPGPYLVVCPKTASEAVWRREIARWLPSDHRAIILPEFRYQRARRLALTRYGPKTWLIIHPEIAMVQVWIICAECGERTPEGAKQQKQLSCGHIKNRACQKLIDPSYPKLFEIEWGAIISDESHDMLIARKGKPTQRRRGMMMLNQRPDGKRIASSGTPFDSKPYQLWGTLNWLDPTQYPAFHRWAELYWTKGGYTGFEIGEFRKDREKMLWDSLSDVAIRRTKAEVAKDLPPKIEIGTPLDPRDPSSPIGIWLPMDGKQEQAYRDMEKTSIAHLESGTLEAVTALAELTRLKQLACAYGEIKTRIVDDETHYKYYPRLPSNKFNWIVDSLEEWGYPRDPLTKVVIVSFYTGILEVFAQGIEKHFRTKRPLCTAITGRTPMKDRHGIIDQFNTFGKDTPQIMMLNVKAGGTAITLDTADRMIFISETRIPDQQKQAEDRIHRISNPRQCMYYYLRSLTTVDVGTALVNQELIRDSHRLLDQRRGVDYVRQVLGRSLPLDTNSRTA